MLDTVQNCVLSFFSLQRNGQSKQDPCQCRMHAGLEHANPHKDAQDQIGSELSDAHPVKRNRTGKGQHRQRQRIYRQFRTVENCNNNNRPEVVDNGDRQQEDLECQRHPRSQQRQNTEGKGNVGRRRNCPTAERLHIVEVKPHIDQSRSGHAPDRSQNRQNGFVETCQLSGQNLALYLQTHQKEENCHKTVVDPKQRRLGEFEATHPEPHIGIEEPVVKRRKCRIGGKQGQHRHEYENKSGAGFEPDEVLNARQKNIHFRVLGLEARRLDLYVMSDLH